MSLSRFFRFSEEPIEDATGSEEVQLTSPVGPVFIPTESSEPPTYYPPEPPIVPGDIPFYPPEPLPPEIPTVPEETTAKPFPLPIPPIPAPTEPLYSANSITLPIKISVATIPTQTRSKFYINVDVKPAIPTFGIATAKAPLSLRLLAIPLKLNAAIKAITTRLLEGKVENFFDENREGKTLVNFGSDFQTLATNWIYDPTDTEKSSMLVKLYRPLPDAAEEKMQVWIARELAAPIVDRLFVTYTPAAAPKVYLRPPNKKVSITGQGGSAVSNVTMTNLLTDNAFDPVKPSDPVLEEWFTHDVNASELNIDYADYRNFVFFGSAQSRLSAFANKLTILEDIDNILATQSSSLANSGQIVTGSLPYPTIKKYADQRIEIIRSFDPYERFLYYGTDTPYSASVTTDDVDDPWFVHTDATWPKVSGSVVSVKSEAGKNWFTSQSAIATEYDILNRNSLANNLPVYLKNDTNSQEFVKFVDLIGHHFDILKVYTDHMTSIYDRSSDPSVGMSQDLVWNVANSLGIQLPNQYSVRKLVDYTIGELQVASPKIYREVAAETWKRFLHNQIFLMKTKGTKTALRALANTYGVLPSVLQIKESVTSGQQNSQVYETFEEQTNALNFTTSNSFITLPWNSLPDLPKTVELRFATTTPTASVLANADNTWAITVVPTEGNYGRVVVRTLDQAEVSSSVLPIFSGDFFSAMVRYEPTGVALQVGRVEGDDIIDWSATTESGLNIASIFTAPSALNVGGSGSVFLLPTFRGMMDEVRVWGETISDDTFKTHVKYPGVYSGNTSTSARDSLFVRLSFNKTVNLGATSSLDNETPYVAANNASALATVAATGFPSVPAAPHNMAVVVREVTRLTPNAGSTFTTNKVHIGEAPVYQYTEVADGSLVPVLTRDLSIKSVEEKQEQGTVGNTVGFYFSITDAINDSIIRSVGNIDLQNLIGDPADVYNLNYSALEQLNELYWKYYAYNYNVNSFVDFVQELLDPLFAQAKSLVPARAKLLSGIVHEPHILERQKVVVTKPVQVDDDLTLEASAVTSSPVDHYGTVDSFESALTVSDVTDVSATNASLEGTTEVDEIIRPLAEYSNLTALVERTSAELVTEASMWEGFTSLFDLSNIVSAESIGLGIDAATGATINIANIIKTTTLRYPQETIDPRSWVIEPLTDFTKIESHMYFTNPDGFVAYPVTTRVRTNERVLKDRGTWAINTTYTRNDYVIQYADGEEAELGYGKEYVCISANSNFISLKPPSLDPINWKPMSYVLVESYALRKAVLVNDAVTLASTSAASPIVVGYRPEHFKNTRDRRKGILNHQWIGCLQTDQTTPDGKPAVEVFLAAGDTLLVNDGSAPVQPKNNPSGPILDVL